MRILLSVPTRGSITAETVTRLEAIRDQSLDAHVNSAVSGILYHRGGYSVAMTRNEILLYADRAGYDVVAMVDDDVVPSYGMLDWCGELAGAESHPDQVTNGYGMIAFPHPVVDGAKVRWSTYRDAGEAEGWVFERPRSDGQLHAVDGAATGACILSMAALRRLPGWPTPFRLEQDATGWKGEDLLLCRDLARAGYLVGYVHDSTDLTDHYVSTCAAALAVEHTGLLT